MRKPISLSLPPPSIPYIMTINLHQQQQQLAQVGGAGGDTNPSTVHSFPISDSISTHFNQTHTPITLDLFRSEIDSFPVELEEPSPLPLGWQRFLNLKTGEIYYTKEKEEMSRHGKSPKLDLKLNLSPPRGGSVFMNMNNHNQQQQGGGGGGGGGVGDHHQSPNGSSSAMSSPTSPPSSCVSSENNNSEETSTLRYSNSPEATSMVLVGCPRCLMYVMLSEEDPKCPKCKSTVLLDFLHDNNNNTNKNKKRNNN